MNLDFGELTLWSLTGAHLRWICFCLPLPRKKLVKQPFPRHEILAWTKWRNEAEHRNACVRHSLLTADRADQLLQAPAALTSLLLETVMSLYSLGTQTRLSLNSMFQCGSGSMTFYSTDTKKITMLTIAFGVVEVVGLRATGCWVRHKSGQKKKKKRKKRLWWRLKIAQ